MASQLNQDSQLWARRLEKRTSAVQRMKTLEIYSLVSMVRTREGDWDGAPRTPDPEDRSVSKRAWESKVCEWKTEMYAYCEAHGIRLPPYISV